MNILIVASGSSAKGFVPPDDITVIAVNGVIDWISRCDYWFTLDHSPVNMERMHNPRSPDSSVGRLRSHRQQVPTR